MSVTEAELHLKVGGVLVDIAPRDPDELRFITGETVGGAQYILIGRESLRLLLPYLNAFVQTGHLVPPLEVHGL